jgi:hypothetical protein
LTERPRIETVGFRVFHRQHELPLLQSSTARRLALKLVRILLFLGGATAAELAIAYGVSVAYGMAYTAALNLILLMAGFFWAFAGFLWSGGGRLAPPLTTAPPTGGVSMGNPSLASEFYLSPEGAEALARDSIGRLEAGADFMVVAILYGVVLLALALYLSR